MLKLTTQAGPFWLDLMPDVQILVRPITPTMILVAREEAGKVLQAADEDSTTSAIEASVAIARRLAHLGIMDWTGIGDADGNPLPVTPESVDMALDVWAVFDAIDRRYVDPAFVRQAEKNELSSSPAGTSAAAPNTATPAA